MLPILRRSSFIATVLLGASGCAFADENGRIPGDDLGSFHVVASLEESTCGAGALGSTESWEFDVDLSLNEHALFWLNGDEPVAGTLASDGASFSFDSTTSIAVEEPGPGRLGCEISRTDAASGRLSFDAEEVSGFEGRLRYGFGLAAESDCSEMIGVPGGFLALPCEMAYGMRAARTRAPEP